MSVEELLAMLQEKGLDDDAIKGLLHDALGTLEKDFEEHNEEEMADEDAEAAGKLLGVEL